VPILSLLVPFTLSFAPSRLIFLQRDDFSGKLAVVMPLIWGTMDSGTVI
jgi:hypothetical protein